VVSLTWTVTSSSARLTVLVLIVDDRQLSSSVFAPAPSQSPVRFNLISLPFEHEALVLETHPVCSGGRKTGCVRVHMEEQGVKITD